MTKYFLNEVYAKKQLPNRDFPREPRSPLRETHLLETSGRRDKSTSSSEQRSSSSKRNSFFAKRPKSAVTVGSNEGSARSHTPSGAGAGDASRRSSAADMPVVSAETDASRSRFLFGRSRKLTKSGSSKPRASSPVDADDEGDHRGGWRGERHRRSSSSGRGMRISAPFGFQHVARIEKERLNSSEEPRDIFADFRALRRGHRAAVIGPSREPEPDVAGKEEKTQKRPPPLRPKRSDELLTDQLLSPPFTGMQQLRQIRSAETFASGVPTSPLPQSPGMPPPRRSSGRAAPPNQTGVPFSIDYSQARMSNQSTLSDEWDRLLPLYESRPALNLAEPNAAPSRSIPQENPAEQLRSPMFNPPLEQVPEEPEGTLSNRQSKDFSRQPSIRHAKSSPVLSRSSSRVSKSSGRANARSPTPITVQITERPLSQGSDTLGDPSRLSTHKKHNSGSKEFSKPYAITRDTADSWEDDIDYCYEHAAEADFDFNWNVSRLNAMETDDLYRDDGPFSSQRILKRQQSNSMESTISSEGDQYRLPSRVYKAPSKDAVPELEYRSSHSTSTNSISILTPLDKFSFPSSDILRPNSQTQKSTVKDVLSPQLLPLDFKNDLRMSQIYDEVIAKADSVAPHVPVKSDARFENRVSDENVERLVDLPKLLTPPPSASSSPIIPRSTDNNHPTDLRVNTIVAQLRRPLDSPISPETPGSPEYPPPPPPKSPRCFPVQIEDDIPQLKPRSYASTLNAAKLKLFDAQSKLQDWSPKLPRNESDDSVVTAVALSKPPTPPKTPSSAEIAGSGMTFLSSPSPISPIETPYFTPLTSSPVLSQQLHKKLPERPQSHRKVSSDSAAPVNSAPMTPLPPNSPSNAPTLRPSRSSYSLFPPKARELPQMKSPTVPNFSAGLKSAPLYGGFPAGLKSPVNTYYGAGMRSPPPPSMKTPRSKGGRLATV